MCPGGFVVASSSQEGHVVTNGMSNYLRDAENANSAVLVGVDVSDFGEEDVLSGVRFQENLERAAFEAGGRSGRAPSQRLGDFLENITLASDLDGWNETQDSVSVMTLHAAKGLDTREESCPRR
jgi:uncharacterized FAD-dependent dehydrogenase